MAGGAPRAAIGLLEAPPAPGPHAAAAMSWVAWLSMMLAHLDGFGLPRTMKGDLGVPPPLSTPALGHGQLTAWPGGGTAPLAGPGVAVLIVVWIIPGRLLAARDNAGRPGAAAALKHPP